MSKNYLSKYKKAKQEYIDSYIRENNTSLFGRPPQKAPSGKLFGATPPNMEVLSRILQY